MSSPASMPGMALTDKDNNISHSEKHSPIHVDLSRVKDEPMEFESVPQTATNKMATEGAINDQDNFREQAMPMRFSRTRYVRRSYSSPESSVCEVCQAEFAGPDVLRLHKIAHFNTATVCYVCDGIFIDTNSAIGSKISLHMASNHKAICTPTGTYKPEAERSFVCPICLQRFSSNKILTLHTLRQHRISEPKNMTCKICSIEHSSTRALQVHLFSSQHKDMKIKIQSLFMCVDCRAVFPARDSYAMHMMIRAQSESCTSLDSIAQANNWPVSLEALSPRSTVVSNEYSLPTVKAVSNQNNIKAETTAYVKRIIAARLAESKLSAGYKCNLCGLQFYHPDTLNIHMKMNHDNLTDVALLQQRVAHQFDLEKTMSLFRGLEKSGASWTCIACGFDFYSCDALAMHVMERHSSNTLGSLSEFDLRSQFKTRTPPLRLSLDIGSKSPQNKPPSLVTAHSTHVDQVANVQTELNSTSPKASCTETHSATNDTMSAQHTDEPNAKVRKMSSDNTKVCDTKQERSDFFSKCSFCRTTFESKAHLLLHFKNCVSEKERYFILKCICCHEQFLNLADYSLHDCRDNSDKNSVMCLSCEQIVTSSNANEHFETGNRCSHLPRVELSGHETVPKISTNEVESIETNSEDLDAHCNNDNNCTSRNGDIGKLQDVTYREGVTSAEASKLNVVKNQSVNDSMYRTKVGYSPPLSDSLEKDNIIQALVQDAIANKRKRKEQSETKPVANPQQLLNETGNIDEFASITDQPGLIAIPISPASSPYLTEALPVLENGATNVNAVLDASGQEHLEGQALFNYVLSNSPQLIMCKYCHIIYTNRTMYYLHLGLHNLNNPWQCNLCGKICANVHEFSSHVIHYR